ncbi:hypothetical protein CU015_0477 [Enterococcus faecium]|nr:hypothetical protein [Enterococcus faecium]
MAFGFSVDNRLVRCLDHCEHTFLPMKKIEKAVKSLLKGFLQLDF